MAQQRCLLPAKRVVVSTIQRTPHLGCLLLKFVEDIEEHLECTQKDARECCKLQQASRPRSMTRKWGADLWSKTGEPSHLPIMGLRPHPTSCKERSWLESSVDTPITALLAPDVAGLDW